MSHVFANMVLPASNALHRSPFVYDFVTSVAFEVKIAYVIVLKLKTCLMGIIQSLAHI